MYLSKLVFQSIKNVFYLDEDGFNYRGFLRGSFDDDPDYDTHINNVFAPLNEAISRLSDLERIPYIVEEVNVDANNTIDLTTIEERLENPRKIKEVIAVGQFINGRPEKLAFKFNNQKVYIGEPIVFGKPVYLEYKEDIPFFEREDIPSKDPLTDDVYEESAEEYKDVDMKKQYGISDSMCNYIIEYVQGKLQEPDAPDLANMHITRAEAYFNNIKPVSQTFVQHVVRNYYRIED